MSTVTKFQSILASTGADVLNKRAANVLKAAAAAMTKKVTAIQDKIDAIEIKILDLTDLSVETKDSLRPGDKNFNATYWVEELCALTLEKTLLEQELAVAEDVQAEYFSEEVAEA